MTVVALCLTALPGCAEKPTAYETLPQLKQAIDEPVMSAEQNKQHSALAQLVSEEGHLEGLTRTDIEAKVGRGDACPNIPCAVSKGSRWTTGTTKLEPPTRRPERRTRVIAQP